MRATGGAFVQASDIEHHCWSPPTPQLIPHLIKYLEQVKITENTRQTQPILSHHLRLQTLLQLQTLASLQPAELELHTTIYARAFVHARSRSPQGRPRDCDYPITLRETLW